MDSNPNERKALWLSWFTVVYNILEGLVSVLIGSTAGSIALVGFGLDSFIESISGMIMIWRFSKGRQAERRALKLVGWSFLTLGIYVGYEAISKIVAQEIARPTIWGIAIASISIAVMIFCYTAKRKIGESLKSASLIADAKQALACIAMSVSLLIGSTIYYFFNIWWIDSAVAVLIALLSLKEGVGILRGDGRCH
mgnify:CR=1 FL=1